MPPWGSLANVFVSLIHERRAVTKDAEVCLACVDMERLKFNIRDALVILTASSAKDASWVREIDRLRELVRLSKASRPFWTIVILLPTVARFPAIDWVKTLRYLSVCLAD